MATLLSDNFDRANSTTTVGSPQIGPAPTVHVGVGGISTNALYTPTQPCVISWELGTANAELTGTYTGLPTGATAFHIVLGLTDANNYYTVYFAAGGVVLYQYVGGTPVQLTSSNAKPPVANSVCRAHYRDGVVRAYVDDVLTIRWTLDVALTGTKHGIRSSSTNVRIDSLLGTDAPSIAEPTLTGNEYAIAPGAGVENTSGFLYKGRDTKVQDQAAGA